MRGREEIDGKVENLQLREATGATQSPDEGQTSFELKVPTKTRLLFQMPNLEEYLLGCPSHLPESYRLFIFDAIQLKLDKLLPSQTLNLRSKPSH